MESPRFDVDAFEGMIADRGKLVQWERARECPCFNQRSRSPDRNCLQCHGQGRVYTPMGQFTATVLSITSSKKYAKFGAWLAGDALMTFPARYLVGDKDRITLVNGLARSSATLVRGERDTVREAEIVEVLECGDSTRRYTPGIDFRVVGQEIVWVGAQPTAGTAYSVLYTARPVYVVWMDLPQERAHVLTPNADGTTTEREMPRKVALRLFVDLERADGA